MATFTITRNAQQIADRDLDGFKQETTALAKLVFGETNCLGMQFKVLNSRSGQIIVIDLPHDGNITADENLAFIRELNAAKLITQAQISAERSTQKPRI